MGYIRQIYIAGQTIIVREKMKRNVQAILFFMAMLIVSVVPVSAATKQGLDDLLNAALRHVENYVELITPFLHHKRTWIRNIAKKYIQKFK